MKNRRDFTKSIAELIFATFIFCGLFPRCKNPKKESLVADPCHDLSDLTESEMATRQQLVYIDNSSFADRNCANCQLFVKTDTSLTCGNCLAMKGPVADSGYCTVWAPVV